MPFDMEFRVYSNEHLIGILSQMETVARPNYLRESRLILDSPAESLILSTKAQPVLAQQRRTTRGTFRTTSTPTRATAYSVTPFPKTRTNTPKYDGLFQLPNDYEEHLIFNKNAPAFENPTPAAVIETIPIEECSTPVPKKQPEVKEKDPFNVKNPSYFYSLVHNTMNESSCNYDVTNKGLVAVDQSNKTTNYEKENFRHSGVSTELDYLTANESQIMPDIAHSISNKEVVEIEPITNIISMTNDLHVTKIQKSDEPTREQVTEDVQPTSNIKEELKSDNDAIVSQQLDDYRDSLYKTEKVKTKKEKLQHLPDPDDGFVGFSEKPKKIVKKKPVVQTPTRGSYRASARNVNNSRQSTGATPFNNFTAPKRTIERGVSNRAVQKQKGNQSVRNNGEFNKSLEVSEFIDDRFISIDEIIKETKEKEQKEVQEKPKPEPQVIVKPTPPPERIMTIEQIAAEQRQQQLKSDQNKKGGFWNNVMNML